MIEIVLVAIEVFFNLNPLGRVRIYLTAYT